jgi:anti-anti-sigma regulatory factor
MESYTFKKLENKDGQIKGLEIGGLLVLENANDLKRDFLSTSRIMDKQLKINISDVSDIDLSFIQLLLAFITEMGERHVTYSLKWNLDDDQKTLLENVGLSSELFINN